MLLKENLPLSPPILLRAIVLCIVFAIGLPAANAQDNDLIQLVIDLLNDNDRDVRALAFEQVRTEAKGEAATRKFAAQIPKLDPDGQVGLLRALAERRDRAARPEVLKVLDTTRDNRVRIAAIEALGPLGNSTDVRRLVAILEEGTEPQKKAAESSLIRIQGADAAKTIVGQMDNASPNVQARLLAVLTTRRATDTLPDIVAAASSNDATVRAAAMTSLAQLAGPDQMGGMVKGVLKAEPGKEREAAEKAVMVACKRLDDGPSRAKPLLAAMDQLDQKDRTILLSTLGRVGGTDAVNEIMAAVADKNIDVNRAGFKALCNWPDASVAPQLIDQAKNNKSAGRRTTALRALIRVAPLRDGRTDAEKLELLKQAMKMASRDEEKKLAIKRAAAIRTVDSLRFVLPYADQTALSEQACESVVELAHHRGLRDANKEEFHKALDKVIATSKDNVVVDRANRYKRGQTWVRPK